MGWVLQEDRGLLLAQGRYPARLAAIDAPNINAFGLVTGLKTYTPTRAGRPHDPPQRPARAALRRPRTASGCCTTSTSSSTGINARLRAEKSTAEAVHARRHVRGQRARRPDLRPGRRRRGAGARSSSARCASASATAQAQTTVRRPHRARRRRHADDDHQARPVRRGPGETRRATRSLDAGVLTAADVRAARPRRRAHAARWASNFLIVGAQALHHGPPAVRRRPADRLLLPRPDARGRHQGPGHRGARRDSPGDPGQHPDRPRAGLRVEPHIGRLRPRSTSSSRCCAAARRTKYRYKGRCRRWARSTPA